ncbi:hypothetical protein AVEN_46107-1 [Araneus ventricosus]|uniref:Uncharacterized protein n=1 Tax=Araneus ventricosus TaxID=182803 RepID=A0A4Y2SGC7_ARAVE|nr:hypothetical protein AVEN_46107-1 [Araneus ventricosus]
MKTVVEEEKETEEERLKRLEADADYREHIHQQLSQDIVNQSLYICESQVETQHCEPMNVICEFCKAKNFLGERPSDNTTFVSKSVATKSEIYNGHSNETRSLV